MGWRFRKSVKIAPGVRVNFGKKSTSVSFGGKGFRTTYSSTGRKTTSFGIPGTGLSYSKSTSTKKRSPARKSSPARKKPLAKDTSKAEIYTSKPVTPQYSAKTYKVCGIISMVLAIPILVLSLPLALAVPVGGFFFAALGLLFLALGIVWKKAATTITQEEPKRLARNAELLEWQNSICEDKSEQLFMSAIQLEEATVQAVSNDIRIFDDCSSILNKTSNPSVFFPRLTLAEETLNHLCSLEPYMNKVKQITMNETPSALQRQFLDNKERYVCDFIYKYYWTVKDKAETLKTEKGKQNQYQKFYDSLQPYFSQISEQNMKYIEAMYQQKI